MTVLVVVEDLMFRSKISTAAKAAGVTIAAATTADAAIARARELKPSLVVLARFRTGEADFQLVERIEWVKDWGIFQSWGRLVAASGMTAVTFTHRLGYPKTAILDGASDVADAIAYVRAHAAELGVDGDRLCLAAYSAGGPMLSPFLSDPPPYVRCLVAFYAIMDIRQSEPHRQSETAETLERFSPIVQIARNPAREHAYRVLMLAGQAAGRRGHRPLAPYRAAGIHRRARPPRRPHDRRR